MIHLQCHCWHAAVMCKTESLSEDHCHDGIQAEDSYYLINIQVIVYSISRESLTLLNRQKHGNSSLIIG